MRIINYIRKDDSTSSLPAGFLVAIDTYYDGNKFVNFNIDTNNYLVYEPTHIIPNYLNANPSTANDLTIVGISAHSTSANPISVSVNYIIDPSTCPPPDYSGDLKVTIYTFEVTGYGTLRITFRDSSNVFISDATRATYPSLDTTPIPIPTNTKYIIFSFENYFVTTTDVVDYECI